MIRGWGNCCIRKVDCLVVNMGVDDGVTWYVTFHVQIPDMSMNYEGVSWVKLGVDELVFVAEGSVCSLQQICFFFKLINSKYNKLS